MGKILFATLQASYSIDKTVNKAEIRDVAFRYGLACQLMLSDHAPKTYSVNYYGNLAAGVFTRNGAQLGWQLADLQAGERLDDDALESLLRKSLQACARHYNAPPPDYLVNNPHLITFWGLFTILSARAE